jgi:23S rRNA (adenine-N6)-dimethyltransferase
MLYKLRRKTLHQNFIWNRQIVKRLVRLSSIGKNDLVYEIGPGLGIITRELASKAWKVIAVELDTNLAKRLKSELSYVKNLEVHNQDFLRFKIYSNKYKVFANPPFTISGDIIKKLLHSNNPPLECYLVLQKEYANKIMGDPYEGVVSLQYKPWFKMEIIHRFNRGDFRPKATVDCVLVHITRRANPLLPVSKRKRFIEFLSHQQNLKYQNWTKWIEEFTT